MSKFQIFGFLLGIMRKVLLKHKINFIFKNKNIAQFCWGFVYLERLGRFGFFSSEGFLLAGNCGRYVEEDGLYVRKHTKYLHHLQNWGGHLFVYCETALSIWCKFFFRCEIAWCSSRSLVDLAESWRRAPSFVAVAPFGGLHLYYFVFSVERRQMNF